MNVTPYSRVTPRFSGKIIDCHTHIGEWAKDGVNIPASSLTHAINQIRGQDTVEAAVVSSLTCFDTFKTPRPPVDEFYGNLALLKECQTDDRLKPLAVCQPGYGNPRVIERLLETHPQQFYGFKFFTLVPGMPANDRRYYAYMGLAQQHNLPCVFHSDEVGSNGDPRLIYDLAKKFPTVPVVLYHMSMAPAAQVGKLPASEIEKRGLQGKEDQYVWNVRESWNRDGINVVKEALQKHDANMYLEVSWVKPETVVEAIQTVGADRVLFGSDAPLGDFGRKDVTAYKENIQAIKKAITQAFPENAKQIINQVFYQNARQLFFERHSSTFSPKPVSTGLVSGLQAGQIPPFRYYA